MPETDATPLPHENPAEAGTLWPPASTEPTPLRPRFLTGPAGVGWGFLLFVAIFFVLRTVLSLLVKFLVRDKLPVIWNFAVGEIFSLISAVVPALILCRLEGRAFGVYGLPRSSAFRKNFWVGMVWGIVAITVLLAGLRAAGGFYFGSIALTPVRAAEYALFWGVFFILVGLFEEFFLRGYTQFTLSRGLGFWPTALILSSAFGAMHLSNKGETPAGALGAALIGLFFCLTLRRTGDLWFAVGLHAAWDWGETYLYGVADSGLVAPGHLLNSSSHGPAWLSGGTVGPEASLFVFILMGTMAVLFHYSYRGVKYPDRGPSD